VRALSVVLLAAGGLLAAVPAAASERHVTPSGSGFERRILVSACADAKSRSCSEAMVVAVPRAAASLQRLAERRHPRAAELARRAADSAFPELRSAAAAAMGQLSVEASFTPFLGELLDDPVPAVRAAARAALYGSMDERGRALAARADRFGTPAGETALAPDTLPLPARLGVALPADAVYLFFASDVAAGRYTYLTGERAPSLVARLSKAGSGPYAPEQWYDMLLAQEQNDAPGDGGDDGSSDSGAPSADDFAKAMEMMAKMNEALEAHPDAETPEQQAQLMAKAISGKRNVDPDLGNNYGDAELFGEVKLFLIELADGGDVAVAVYYDKVLQSTGFAVHKRP